MRECVKCEYIIEDETQYTNAGNGDNCFKCGAALTDK
jgi:hypothetical protein